MRACPHRELTKQKRTRRSRDPEDPRGQGGRLREELIAAATRLMAAGSREDQITLRAVAREAGVAPQSFYLHFASIDQPLWDLYPREFAALAERLTGAAASARDPHRRLFAVCQARAGASPVIQADVLAHWAARPRLGREAARLPHLRGHPRGRRRLSPEQNEATTAGTTSLLWAALHGLVALRNDRPAFPWAPLETLLEELLAALLPQPTKHPTSNGSS